MKASKGILESKKNGNHYSFLYDYRKIYLAGIKANVYSFDIWEKGKEGEPMFQPLLKIENETEVIDLYPPDYYRGKGISQAFVLEVKQVFGKRIISSSNNGKTEMHEARRDDATEKVWKPMVEMRLAAYDPDKDYYYVL